MIKTVFLDVDGVLVDFRKGIHNVFGKPYDYPTLSNKWLFWDDWPDVTFKQVNDVCTILFWAELEWIFDGKEILATVEKKFEQKNIYLLTTSMPNPESSTGRMLWIKDHLPNYYKRTIIVQASKELLAQRNTLLIDDKDENVIEFREAGGKAILVPRPWNFLYNRADESLEIVKQSLEKICVF